MKKVIVLGMIAATTLLSLNTQTIGSENKEIIVDSVAESQVLATKISIENEDTVFKSEDGKFTLLMKSIEVDNGVYLLTDGQGTIQMYFGNLIHNKNYEVVISEDEKVLSLKESNVEFSFITDDGFINEEKELFFTYYMEEL